MSITPTVSWRKPLFVALLLFGIYAYEKRSEVVAPVVITVVSDVAHMAPAGLMEDGVLEEGVTTSTSSSTSTRVLANGTYEVYNKSKVEAMSPDTRVILFFDAPWDTGCQKTDKWLRTIKLPQNFNIFFVDYDSYEILREKYNIVTSCIFVEVDKEGQELKRWSGNEIVTVVE